ncbi:UNVERIFIED_CONTAM: hypothetical protein Sradi_3008400 [Sesamum radiatum]|uniref:Uncharacterized protein n=1 Tax=Sesamum radiatum TaxID=300843 RepID=A0AAW2S355_SESRA
MSRIDLPWIEQTEGSQLIQFLTRLSDSYDNIRSQILVLDPLPHVNKAFSMILPVEWQRQVNMNFIDTGDNSAFFGRGQEHRGSNTRGYKNAMRKKGVIDKRNLFYDMSLQLELTKYKSIHGNFFSSL